MGREVLKYRCGQYGQPWHFLDFKKGHGTAVTNELDYGTPDAEMKREEQTLDSPDILAIKGLGQFERFKVVSSFRRLIESWHLSDLHIQSARPSQDAGYAEHLSPNRALLGDSLRPSTSITRRSSRASSKECGNGFLESTRSRPLR